MCEQGGHDQVRVLAMQGLCPCSPQLTAYCPSSALLAAPLLVIFGYVAIKSALISCSPCCSGELRASWGCHM